MPRLTLTHENRDVREFHSFLFASRVHGVILTHNANADLPENGTLGFGVGLGSVEVTVSVAQQSGTDAAFRVRATRSFGVITRLFNLERVIADYYGCLS